MVHIDKNAIEGWLDKQDKSAKKTKEFEHHEQARKSGLVAALTEMLSDKDLAQVLERGATFTIARHHTYEGDILVQLQWHEQKKTPIVFYNYWSSYVLSLDELNHEQGASLVEEMMSWGLTAKKLFACLNESLRSPKDLDG